MHCNTFIRVQERSDTFGSEYLFTYSFIWIHFTPKEWGTKKHESLWIVKESSGYTGKDFTGRTLLQIYYYFKLECSHHVLNKTHWAETRTQDLNANCCNFFLKSRIYKLNMYNKICNKKKQKNNRVSKKNLFAQVLLYIFIWAILNYWVSTKMYTWLPNITFPKTKKC